VKKGLTLVELLAALVISSIVVALAGRIFLSGNKGMAERANDSDRLEKLFSVKTHMQNLLTRPFLKCDREEVTVQIGRNKINLQKEIRRKFPFADSLEIKCLVADTATKSFRPWNGIGQPQLVEYQVSINGKKSIDKLEGSVLK
jgi:prepilin-type N-terminal cleavage/methylation domain-containing protein